MSWLKVISGDSAGAGDTIARRAGLNANGSPIDADLGIAMGSGSAAARSVGTAIALVPRLVRGLSR